jgi:hypothetical protein
LVVQQKNLLSRAIDFNNRLLFGWHPRRVFVLWVELLEDWRQKRLSDTLVISSFIVSGLLSLAISVILSPLTSLIYILSRLTLVVGAQPMAHNPAKKTNMAIVTGIAAIGLGFTAFISQHVLHVLAGAFGFATGMGSIGASAVGAMILGAFISIAFAGVLHGAKKLAQQQNVMTINNANTYASSHPDVTAPKHHFLPSFKASDLLAYEQEHERALSYYCHSKKGVGYQRKAVHNMNHNKLILTQYERVTALHRTGKLTQEDYDQLSDAEIYPTYQVDNGRLVPKV